MARDRRASPGRGTAEALPRGTANPPCGGRRRATPRLASPAADPPPSKELLDAPAAPAARAVTPAALAGVLFVAEAIVEVAHHQADHFHTAGDYAVEVAFAIALATAAAAFAALRHAGGRMRVGATIGAAGQGALALCSVATIVHGADALGPLFVLGLLASLVGPVVIATTGPRGRAVGAALAVGLVASSAIPHGGAAVLGLAWLVAASLLRDPVPEVVAAVA